IKAVVDEEVRKAKESIDEATKLSVSDSKDKLERYMDRLTNEKMMAVNEYSDTVIQQIKKDHEEAVFLYDMIDNKHSQVKNTAAELNQLEKDVKRLSENIRNTQNAEPVRTVVAPAEKEAVPEVINTVSEAPAPDVIQEITVPPAVTESKAADSFETLTPDRVEVSDDSETVTKSKPVKKSKAAKKEEAPASSEGPIGGDGIELMFDSDMGSMNNNDRILALHKEGKSNMAIAKELGLGVGEVKLVIDLFKS
ncbi:MAG: hypothetical protein IK123_06100, partial [Lachnospiraceae bacterium]|nr:hypothetical protein [Lachnospiraceae bacterium]